MSNVDRIAELAVAVGAEPAEPLPDRELVAVTLQADGLLLVELANGETARLASERQTGEVLDWLHPGGAAAARAGVRLVRRRYINGNGRRAVMFVEAGR